MVIQFWYQNSAEELTEIRAFHPAVPDRPTALYDIAKIGQSSLVAAVASCARV
jgi:hypothetical protein